MLPTRVHSILGYFNRDGVMDENMTKELNKENSISAIRRRIEICSIIVPTQWTMDNIKPNVAVKLQSSNTLDIIEIQAPPSSPQNFTENDFGVPKSTLELNQRLISDDLLTIKFLRKHGLNELVKQYSLKAVKHQTHPNLVELSYSQTGSPMHEKIVQECRGIILDSKNLTWNLVALPYLKFFNAKEKLAEPIDWEGGVVVSEKLDGSLAILYYYADRWWVASSAVPDGSNVVSSNSQTFAQIFWEIWYDNKYELPEDPTMCYMFELWVWKWGGGWVRGGFEVAFVVAGSVGVVFPLF